MHSRYKMILAAMTALVCLVGCTGESPTAVSEIEQLPSTETQAPPTRTPALHTELPTQIPPTATPAYDGPVISQLEGQTIPDGGQFTSVALDAYVTDPDHPPEEIAWTCSGNVELNARITRRVLVVTPPYIGWTGAEVLTLEACDPDAQCATTEVTYSVEWVNDPPIVSDISDQMIFTGESFTQIALDDYVEDPDNPDEEITWSFTGAEDLNVHLSEGVVTVAPPDQDWLGPESIQFQACDPQGLCASSEAIFMVQQEADLKVTFIANAGFLIEAGDKKVLIDALLQGWDGYQSLSSVDVLKMETASPPFNDIDLILVTHNHFDHYNPNVVGDHLESNPAAIFLSTSESVENLVRYENYAAVQDRAIGVRVSQGESLSMIVAGIGVEMMFFSHGSGQPDNLGMIITIGGFRLFHPGDLNPTDAMETLTYYQIPEREFDIAFVPVYWPSPSYHQFIREGTNAKYIIPMHFDPMSNYRIEEMQTDFPNAIVLREKYASWELAH